MNFYKLLVKISDLTTDWYLKQAHKKMTTFHYEQVYKLYHRFRLYFVFIIALSILILIKPIIKVEIPVYIENTNHISAKEIENSNLEILGFLSFFKFKKEGK